MFHAAAGACFSDCIKRALQIADIASHDMGIVSGRFNVGMAKKRLEQLNVYKFCHEGMFALHGRK